jgi:hypothetical protein
MGSPLKANIIPAEIIAGRANIIIAFSNCFMVASPDTR